MPQRLCHGERLNYRNPGSFGPCGPVSGTQGRDLVWWNSHHVTLFYYVARYRGISAALPHIPYGIQQPALSAQMRELEEQISHTLFTRQPFALTPMGEQVYAEVKEFVEGLNGLLGER